MDHASRHYPQVRSIFEFIAEQGKLDCWYTALVEHYEDDRTGALAFRTCFGLPLDDIERAWRRWVFERPPVDIAIQYGDAALGIESRPRGSNDGVLITRVLPGSAAAEGGLEVGDVVVAVDDQPTRSLTELQTIIASRTIGESVSIRARRNRNYFVAVVTLRPLRRIMW
jgi:S1-C subfamily serine protease